MASLGGKPKHNPKQDCGGWNRIRANHMEPKGHDRYFAWIETEPTGDGDLMWALC